MGSSLGRTSFASVPAGLSVLATTAAAATETTPTVATPVRNMIDGCVYLGSRIALGVLEGMFDGELKHVIYLFI